MPLRLIIEDDEGTTTIVPLGEDAITIGRQQGNTIQLTEKNVSRRHARLCPDGETWIIEDLGSYNGVKVNGASIDARVSLKEGDVVQIGDYHLALTNDADQRTVNYEPQQAANDNEPMLASSSTDLPRLSADELASLQSGTASAGSAAAYADPTSLTPPHAPVETERQRSGSGLLVGFAIVVLAAVGLGVFWMINTGNVPPEQPVQAADDRPNKAITPVSAEPKDDKPTEPQAPDEPPGDEPPTPPPIGDEPLANGSGAEDEPDPVDEPPTDASTKPKKPVVSKPRSKTPAPPVPDVDADELLKEAQGLQISNPARAYDLAKQSYAAKRSQTAAAVMAFTACRMGDPAKAKLALSRLKGSKRDQMAEQCRKKGLDV